MSENSLSVQFNSSNSSSQDGLGSHRLVLVAGATGGVGQLSVAKLIAEGYRVRVLTRTATKAESMFAGNVEIAVGDIRQPSTLPPATEGITHLICATGTTALPSARWDFQMDFGSNPLEQVTNWARVYLDEDFRNAHARNTPEAVDAIGVSNLVQAAPEDLQRFVFVSSCGVARKDQFPYTILNAYGVLDAKGKGETAILRSGLPYTIIRPGQLTDGPYTSRDFNSLVQASTDSKLGVVMETGDTLNGQTSRIDVAAACVACLEIEAAKNKAVEMISKGDRPSQIDWATLFATA
ncbi:NmrA-like family [Synechococcus sp. PCC 7335]|uniref:SDR family oxidoreductase n=1 Tax=Synechococcus sp. (strain ATCC 29403 / PCC 7335) TaxID=91464 RepID=UPI00017EB4D7|nr:SDR family oxidoreductase [Synechococcus sp. PCC 7335]EDX84458.1 NmrA-like family [Synechococcus sp. PCC 7335]